MPVPPAIRVTISDPNKQAYELAEEFLATKQNEILYKAPLFYRRVVNHYEPYIRIEELKVEIFSFLYGIGYKSQLTERTALNILTCIKGKQSIPNNNKSSFWIDRESDNQYIPLKNALLDLSKFLSTGEIELIEHSPMFFSPYELPFEYDPNAKCPTFIKILETSLPDKETQKFILMWFAYNLILDNSHEIFVVFIGNGLNGKSLLLLILRLLLGEQNYSSVPLEDFTRNKRFALQQTIGKNANIVGEVSDNVRFPEAELKSFISGEPFSIERKFQDPINEKPTARITVACNNHPYFRDSSDGIWRREVLIPFDKTIPKEEINRQYSDEEFWLNNGELPGIFNLVLEALKELHDTGQFIIPQKSIIAKEQYRSELNPIATYLRLNLEYDPSGEIPTCELSSAYDRYCEQHGIKKVSSAILGREIKKIFPQARHGHAKYIPLYRFRSRIWKGLKFIEESDTDNTATLVSNELESNSPVQPVASGKNSDD
ncbi:phage/plasmid primase, P4 family [Halobacteriovorax sp. RZ-3]|uniref:DNA primase family protein n=1 Tax=Halobacteriovorax sp. RZ-3 TaxID=3157720 RepID=UPI003712D86E